MPCRCWTSSKLEGDEATGVDIVRKAVEEPIRWIANNAGKDGAVIMDTVKKAKPGYGYDAEDDEFGDMVKKGIIDPTKVVRTALENASSIAMHGADYRGAGGRYP